MLKNGEIVSILGQEIETISSVGRRLCHNYWFHLLGSTYGGPSRGSPYFLMEDNLVKVLKVNKKSVRQHI